MRRAAQRGVAPAGAVAMLALALLGGCQGEAKERTMAEPGVKTERVYLGRWSLALPAGMTRSDGDCDMQLLTLREELLAPPYPEAFQAAWAGKLAAIARLKAERRRPHYLDGEVVVRKELGPRFALVAYHTDNVKEAARFEALRGLDGVGLWLRRPGDVADQEAIAAAVRKVGLAYRPRPKDGPPLEKEPQAFHLARGAVVLPFEEHEAAQALFRGGPHGAEVELSTETVVEVQKKGLFDRFSESVMAAGAAFGAGVSTVRSGKKSAGPLAGEELVLRDGEKGKLAFIWRFQGESGSGARPEMTLQLSAPAEPRQEVMALWDALVASLAPAAEAAGR